MIRTPNQIKEYLEHLAEITPSKDSSYSYIESTLSYIYQLENTIKRLERNENS